MGGRRCAVGGKGQRALKDPNEHAAEVQCRLGAGRISRHFELCRFPAEGEMGLARLEYFLIIHNSRSFHTRFGAFSFPPLTMKASSLLYLKSCPAPVTTILHQRTIRWALCCVNPATKHRLTQPRAGVSAQRCNIELPSAAGCKYHECFLE